MFKNAIVSPFAQRVMPIYYEMFLLLSQFCTMLCLQ